MTANQYWMWNLLHKLVLRYKNIAFGDYVYFTKLRLLLYVVLLWILKCLLYILYGIYRTDVISCYCASYK